MHQYSPAWAFASHRQAREPPPAPSPVGAHRMALPIQKNLDPTVTVARVLRRQHTHCCQHRRIALGEPRLLTQRRPRHRHQRARSPFRQATRLRLGDLLDQRPGRLAQDRDHVLFRKPALLHDFLSPWEAIPSSFNWPENRKAGP